MAAQKPKPGAYTEIERKFDVVESTLLPSFDGLTAITRTQRLSTQSLDAVYFDTPAHDLARNKITLRRRTGGTDAGWHLKLPAGNDTRTELRAPLTDDDAVPTELRDVVLAIVRDRPLAPVARISTTRNVELLFGADDNAVAEFCDDQVTASAGGDAQQWREWELELAGNCRDVDLLTRLGNRLLDAGATPAGHGSKLARVLNTVSPEKPARPADPIHRAVAEHVTELIGWDRAVRADTDDAVHQMRVTIRKLRSLLKESGLGVADDVLDELRQLAAILGEARDAEVLAEKYDRALAALPAELVRGPMRDRLVDGARRRYASGLRHSLAAMRTARYFRLLDQLEALASAAPTSPADGRRTSVHAAYRRVHKAAKAAHAATTERDEALHRIRKGAKRLRYTAAATGAAKVAEAAKAVQTLLGDHQDAVVSRTHLAAHAEVAHAAGEDTFTYGVLYEQEEELAHCCREQLDGALRTLKRTVKKKK